MKYAVFVAGGTGGHINSALSLGNIFKEANFYILYISGRRDLDFKLYKNHNSLHIMSYGFLGKNIFFILKSFFFNLFSFLFIFLKFFFKRPDFVFGAGGYVCGPVLLAAYFLGVPIYILEQNSVMGFTNRILERFSKTIFTNFKLVRGLKNTKKTKNYGNPVRKEFFDLKHNWEHHNFRILAFGGSLGSSEINSFIINFIKHYDQSNQNIKISILHQVGKVQGMEIPSNYLIEYERSEYIDDIVKEYRGADLIICRGGASTISELRMVKKEVIIIPITLHSDQHQIYNAQLLQEESSFPVHICSVSELEKDNYYKLRDIILKNYKRKKEKIFSKEPFQNENRNPSLLIFNDILKDISE